VSANDLLFWLSARRQGSWQQFREAVETLSTVADIDPREPTVDDLAVGSNMLSTHQFLRQNLELLGHAEFFVAGCERGWRVAPPVLAAVRRNGRFWAVLAGARTTKLLTCIRDAAGLAYTYTHTRDGCPDIVEFTIPHCNTLEYVAATAKVHLQMDAPLAILTSAPTIDDPSLIVAERPLVGTNWEVTRFSPRSLLWETCDRREMDGGAFGLYRLRSRVDRFHFLRMRGILSRVDPRVGKFIVLKKHRERVVTYEPTVERFTIPAACRPPVLIERALALCAGVPPSFNLSSRLLSYSKVPPEIARLAAALLRQEIR
jgi:hypothetical protein